jgi:two-component system sensor histidine kinase and response regulator WspE
MNEPAISIFDLFREEITTQTTTLSTGLVDLEADPSDTIKIEPLMRAAHSLKGAARIVGLDPAVGVAHTMEDALVAAQDRRISLTSADIDSLLQGSDMLASLAHETEESVGSWGTRHAAELTTLCQRFAALARGEQPAAVAPIVNVPAKEKAEPAAEIAAVAATDARPVVRVSREPILIDNDSAMYDVFREEMRSNALTICDGLLEFEREPTKADLLEALQRAAHSIRGATRIVGIEPAALIAGAIEELMVNVQRGKANLDSGGVNVVLEGVGVFAALVELPEEDAPTWSHNNAAIAQELQGKIRAMLKKVPAPKEPPTAKQSPSPENPVATSQPVPGPVVAPARKPSSQSNVAVLDPVKAPERMPVGEPAIVSVKTTPKPVEPVAPAAAAANDQEAVVRVTAGSLNRLMSLAGESLVQARWLQPFSTALLKLKKQQDHLAALIGQLEESITEGHAPDSTKATLSETRKQAALIRQVLSERMSEFEDHAGLAENLNSRLYREVIVSRMRPFSDGAQGLPRMVRDMARKLGKQVKLDIDGLSTEVDRDILEKLEAPLMHLVRNAIDHGMESPEARLAAGKPEQGTIRLEVRHRAGMLAITVTDDGGGIDLSKLSRKIVERGLSTAEMLAEMSEAEVLEFLFLPGFSTATELTEYSGRGVGLDVVQNTVRKVGGNVRVSSKLGHGTTFSLQLPLTLSVLRAVLVNIAGEPYAFPHNRIDRLIRVPRKEIRSLEHRQFVNVDGQNVGLVLAAQLLDLPAEPPTTDELPVLLMSGMSSLSGAGVDFTPEVYGLIVEAFRGEQDLVVRPLDPRLGKVPSISAAAILDDGQPVLIADVEDLIRAMDHYIQSGLLRRCPVTVANEKRKKRVLVVDDSITVREVERQLLRNAGYDVDVAVDGKDGWNAVCLGKYDLLVSDVDMPRMTGLELVKAVREYAPLKDLPIIIVSYKDRESDRMRGLELGANFYLTKNSFQDQSFLRAVGDLIGEP